MVNIDTFHIIIYTLFSSNIFILLENTTVRNDHIMDIYDGDEEIREDENEESEDENEMSEDENEISEDENEVSEYERMMTEFNENDEDKDDRNKRRREFRRTKDQDPTCSIIRRFAKESTKHQSK